MSVAALPLLASLSAQDEAARAALAPMLTAHVAALVEAVDSAPPVERHRAIEALRGVMPPRWPQDVLY